jgi:Pectinacetylesterase
VVEFRGGGACWSSVTCFPEADLFEEQANPEPWMSDETKAPGIYDHSRDDNPFKDWHHVYLGYCTGDVHWGNSTKSYGAGTALASTVEHKGAVNAQAALDWVYANVPNPDKLFVTGCSAGGYGAAFWSAAVREHYAAAKVYQLADSAAGIITETFFEQSFPAWNAKASFPVLTGVDPTTFKQLPELYIGLGKTHPDTFFAEFNTAFDATQHKYFAAMGGGDANEWSQKMQGYLADIAAGSPSFRSYLGAGYAHCAIDKDDFYTREVGGTKLVSWLGDVIADKPVSNVTCKDSDCGSPKPAQ